MTGVGVLDRAVVRWFEENRRDLPWRRSDPWGVYVSEIMLQQTPVRRVLPAWQAWLVETGRESRAARLSTLGLPAGGQGGAWYDDSSQRMR